MTEENEQWNENELVKDGAEEVFAPRISWTERPPQEFELSPEERQDLEMRQQEIQQQQYVQQQAEAYQEEEEDRPYVWDGRTDPRDHS